MPREDHTRVPTYQCIINQMFRAKLFWNQSNLGKLSTSVCILFAFIQRPFAERLFQQWYFVRISSRSRGKGWNTSSPKNAFVRGWVVAFLRLFSTQLWQIPLPITPPLREFWEDNTTLHVLHMRLCLARFQLWNIKEKTLLGSSFISIYCKCL